MPQFNAGVCRMIQGIQWTSYIWFLRKTFGRFLTKDHQRAVIGCWRKSPFMDRKLFKGWEPQGRAQWSFHRMEKNQEMGPPRISSGTKKQ